MDKHDLLLSIAWIGFIVYGILLIVLIEWGINTAIMHPIGSLINFMWVGIIILSVWFILTHSRFLEKLIVDMIVSAIAPSIVSNVITACPKSKKKKYGKYRYVKNKQN
jgi:riboflavin transporter FmnP